MKLLKPTWINHDGHPIFSIDIHPDDAHLATGGQGDDNTGRVVIWNLNYLKDHLKAVLNNSSESSVPKLLCQLDHHNACVNCVRWSNSGRFLASGGDDKVVIIWKLVSRYSGNSVTNSVFEKNNLEVWKTVSILRGHEGDVLDLSWSAKDTYLATCSIDNTIKIWDAQNFPQVVATLQGHTSMVKGVTWDPIGKYIASQSVDKTLRIWRTSDWTTEHVINEPFVDCGGTTHVLRLGWSPDGLYLVSAHAMNYGFPTAQIIERDGWKVDKDFVGHRKAVVCVRFNNNIQEHNRVKQCCVAIGSRDRSISVWSTALKRPVVVIKDVFSHSVMDLTWSHCGTIMMACSWDGSVMAAQFSYTEIGKSLSQEETDSLYQRFYGNTGITANKLNIVPNMEVFLARNNKTEKNQCEVSPTSSQKIEISAPPTSTSDPMPPPPTKMIDMMAVPINKGPSKQIETRTPDGKRRITPKFLPLPNEDDSTLTSLREESTVFGNTEGISTKKEENLRESIQNMVSSIDDVSFGESTKFSGRNNQVVNCSQVNPSSQSQKDESSSPKPIPMEVDPSPSIVAVNGFSGNSKNGLEKNNVNGLVVVVNGTDKNAELNSTTCEPVTKISKALINGIIPTTSTDVPENKSTPASLISSSQQQEQDGELKTTKSDQNPPINIIQIKRKRPIEELKPPVIINKKKFTPQTLRNFPTKKLDECVVQSEPTMIYSSRASVTPKSGCSYKSRLTPLKIDTTLAIQVNIKPESAYSIEVNNNYKRVEGICHQIKCQHFPTSMQGLEWTVCADAPICAVSGDLHRIVALCEDATVHIFDVKGRYAMSPFVLSGYPSRLVQSGRLLLVITVKAILHIWDIHNKTVVIKSESLVPILNQPGGNDVEKAVDITNVYISAGSSPVIFLSNGKSFMFNNGMCTWSLFSDSGGLVSSPIMPEAGTLTAYFAQTKVSTVRRRKPEPAILSHIKLQLTKAIELKKASSIQQWLVVLGKTLASNGLEKELHILCEDLLGPAHSSANIGISWEPRLGGCVVKRTMLREILNCLLDDLRWQDFFCEFDEQLRDVEGSTS